MASGQWDSPCRQSGCRVLPLLSRTARSRGPRRNQPPQQHRESANRYVEYREEPQRQRPIDRLADPSPDQRFVRCRLPCPLQKIALPDCQQARPSQHGLQGDDAEKSEMQGSPPKYVDKPPTAPRSQRYCDETEDVEPNDGDMNPKDRFRHADAERCIHFIARSLVVNPRSLDELAG